MILRFIITVSITSMYKIGRCLFSNKKKMYKTASISNKESFEGVYKLTQTPTL